MAVVKTRRSAALGCGMEAASLSDPPLRVRQRSPRLTNDPAKRDYARLLGLRSRSAGK